MGTHLRYLMKVRKRYRAKDYCDNLRDARNNYHASQSWVIKNIEDKARKVFWLNPEPKSYWDTGDSIVGEYSDFCNGTFEVRNLKQLEAFVENLV